MVKDHPIMAIFTLALLGCFQVAFGQHQSPGNNSLAEGDRSSKCTQSFIAIYF
jgi:hypothetical protein